MLGVDTETLAAELCPLDDEPCDSCRATATEVTSSVWLLELLSAERLSARTMATRGL